MSFAKFRRTTLSLLMTTLMAVSVSACGDDDNGSYSGNSGNGGNGGNASGETNYTSVEFSALGSYEHGDFAESAAEITAFHPASQKGFVVNAQNKKVDVLNLSVPSSPVLVSAVDVSDLGDSVNSVAVSGDLVAMAVQGHEKTDNGSVAIYDANSLTRLTVVTVGALPDMLTFTPDGTQIVVANEGEPSDDYTTDPEGSISIIDVSDIDTDIDSVTVRTATFAAYNTQKQALVDAGVRIFGEMADGSATTVAQDLEPEYIAINSEGTTAYVTLQEANALAVVDIAAGQVSAIESFGYKDHSVAGHGLDSSNKDDAINIAVRPVFGMYQPDSIAYFELDGQPYLVTANEGDAREWGDFAEEVEAGDLTLDSSIFTQAVCGGVDCADKTALGNLKVTSLLGDADNDGVYEALYAYGARSFSIWNPNDMSAPVYDSGSELAELTAERYPITLMPVMTTMALMTAATIKALSLRV